VKKATIKKLIKLAKMIDGLESLEMQYLTGRDVALLEQARTLADSLMNELRGCRRTGQVQYVAYYRVSNTTLGCFAGPTRNVNNLLGYVPDDPKCYPAYIVQCNPDGSETKLYRWSYKRSRWRAVS